jgi:hypothetical protein
MNRAAMPDMTKLLHEMTTSDEIDIVEEIVADEK